MSRVLGIPSLLIVLVIGGYLMTKQMQSSPSSPPVQQGVAQAQAAVAETNFSQANASMQAFFTQNETYLGAALPPGSGVVLVSTTAASYCLQTGDEHEDGPGGSLQSGAC
ncbi:MAG TPA: hypothetical protein VGL76_02315 [Gaiellaceae bacterium]|jgi:hypothetical protein